MRKRKLIKELEEIPITESLLYKLEKLYAFGVEAKLMIVGIQTELQENLIDFENLDIALLNEVNEIVENYYRQKLEHEVNKDAKVHPGETIGCL